MKHVLSAIVVAAALWLGGGDKAAAQCSGQFPARTYCGNSGSALGLPGPIPSSEVATFLQSGTGAVTVTFDSIFRATWIDPIMYGAVCGETDSGPKIQLAMNYARTIGATVKLKPCVYNVATPLVDSVGIAVEGQIGSIINFTGTGTQIAYRVRQAGVITAHGSLSNVQFITPNITDAITAIEIEDASTYNLRNIIIRGTRISSAGAPMWGGAGAIGLRTRGREFIRTDNMQIAAARPVVISKNPNGGPDWDFPNFSNLYLLGDNGPNFEIETGVNLTHANISDVACVLGTDCIYHNDTTSTGVGAEGLTINNLGSEQSQSPSGTTIFIHRNTPLYGLSVGGYQVWDGQRKGFDLTNVVGASFSNVVYLGNSLRCIKVDATVKDLSWTNSYWATGCTTDLTGQNLIRTVPTTAGRSTSASARYSTEFGSDVVKNSTYLSAGGGNITVTTPNTALSPVITWPTVSGTTAVTASSPVVLNSTTGNLTCATCVTSSGGGPITGTSPISVSAAGVVSFAPAGTSLGVLYNNAGALGNTAAGTNGQVFLGVTSSAPVWSTMSGDATIANSGALTFATVNGNVGTFGSATQAPQFTVNAKGLITAAANVTITPASSSIVWSGTSGGIPYFNSTTTIASSALLAANQIVLGGGAATAPATLGSLGTTTTLLHGNAAGAPTFGAVVSADMNITTTSCTNQFVTAISAGGVGTCTTDTLASAQHANQGTTTTVLHGNAAGNPSWAAVSLTTDATGTLQAAQEPAHTGDVTNSAGSLALSITNSAVTYAKIQNLGALAVMGRSANTSGVGADIQATAASDAVLRESGSTIGFGTIATGGIANNAVTLAKLATQATNTVLGNATSGTAVPTALSVGTCSTASSALIWTTNTGFGCNTSITASSATTATNATNVGITDDTTTNATMYLTWVTATTGNLPEKVSSSKLTFNPSTGLVTAFGKVAVGTSGSATNDILQITSSTSAATSLGFFQSGVGQWGIGLASGSNLFRITSNGVPGVGTDYYTINSATGVNSIPSATAATSTSTGALVVSGGVGVAGATWTNTLAVPGIAADTATVDNTVCVSSTGLFLKGSGALGVCLGTSSAKFKHDIAPMGAGLAEIVQLAPKNFFYNKGYGDDGKRQQYGFIAEEVVKVLPGVTAPDKDGKPQSVDMLSMVPILVRSVQQLKVANDNFESRLEKLENRK